MISERARERCRRLRGQIVAAGVAALLALAVTSLAGISVVAGQRTVSTGSRGTPRSTPLTLTVPGSASATVAVVAGSRFVVAAWGATAPEGSTDIYAAVSRDSGLTFSPPISVDGTGSARVSGEQPPVVSLAPNRAGDPSVIVMWTAKDAGGTRLLVARSDNGGGTFGRAAVVPGADGPGNRGWEAITVDRDRHPVGIWLDHREMARDGSGSTHHEHHPRGAEASGTDGVARAQLSKLLFGRLDGGVARAVTGGVCYCCRTAIAAGADGALYAA